MHQICWIPLHVTLRYFYMKYFIQAAQQDDTRQCFKPWTPKGPGFVVYIIAPNDDMPLTGLEAQEREVEMKVFRSEFTTPKTLLILTEMVQMAQGRAMCHDWCGVSGLWEIFFGTFHHLPQRCWFLSHPCCSCAKWCDRGLDRQDDLAECDFLKNCGDSQVMFKFRVQSMFSSRNVGDFGDIRQCASGAFQAIIIDRNRTRNQGTWKQEHEPMGGISTLVDCVQKTQIDQGNHMGMNGSKIIASQSGPNLWSLWYVFLSHAAITFVYTPFGCWMISHSCHILSQERLEPGRGGRQKGPKDGRWCEWYDWGQFFCFWGSLDPQNNVRLFESGKCAVESKNEWTWMNVLYLLDEKKLEEKRVKIRKKVSRFWARCSQDAGVKVVSTDLAVRQVTESNRVLRPLAVHSSRGYSRVFMARCSTPVSGIFFKLYRYWLLSYGLYQRVDGWVVVVVGVVVGVGGVL